MGASKPCVIAAVPWAPPKNTVRQFAVHVNRRGNFGSEHDEHYGKLSIRLLFPESLLTILRHFGIKFGREDVF
jgi:hypothetical protein